MRLIGRIDHPTHAKEFSDFLEAEGIRHRLEEARKPSGEASFLFWIVNEDDLASAKEWWNAFTLDPDNPMFRGHGAKATALRKAYAEAERSQHAHQTISMRPPSRNRQPVNETPLTLALLILCTLIFVLTAMAPSQSGLSREIHRGLAYDYPLKARLADELQEQVGRRQSLQVQELSLEQQQLLQLMLARSSWQGLYPWALALARGDDAAGYLSAPMFESAQEGQLWRFVSPIFLHGSILHILFNMMWMLMLGTQAESRLGLMRYALLIIILALASNTAQYLMSGANFIGISGVVCGLASFVWNRQRSAPWEGYNLPQSTYTMILFFVGLMLAIQLVAFLGAAQGSWTSAPGIANTAHITGALTGIVLARINFFSWRQN
jgi:GlpG protein